MFNWFFRRRRGAPVETTQELKGQQAPANESHHMLGGRRHVADAPYVLPANDQEINRLDFQHYMLRYALRGNYVAPLDRPLSILDVGCGTGRWALEMGALFPQANIVGIDLHPPKHADSTASAGRSDNFTFIQGNILNGLPFADASFDFVHMRLMLFSIPAADWPTVLQELVRVTRVGGWVESVETGAHQRCGPAMELLVAWINQMTRQHGIDATLGPQVGEMLGALGLTQQVRRTIELPVGRHGGRLGAMAQTDVVGVLNGLKAPVAALGITSAADYETALATALAELDLHRGVLPFYVAYGQRVR